MKQTATEITPKVSKKVLDTIEIKTETMDLPDSSDDSTSACPSPQASTSSLQWEPAHHQNRTIQGQSGEMHQHDSVSAVLENKRMLFLLSLQSDVDKMTEQQFRKFRGSVVSVIDDIFSS